MSETDFKKIEKKWQERWEKEKIFQVESDNRKKYYIPIVYPYMNGLLHLGHLFTYTFSEVMARYKRMQGFNVLVKFGFHCTGTPIIAAAKRIEEGEKKQIEILKQMGIQEKEIPKFADPLYWINYFPKETVTDLKAMGFAIDERYTFRTTSINPPYDAMVRWQFNRLKEKGYVKQGKHPVVWCPKDNLPVGDHDRLEGEGEYPKDFIWVKFRLKDSDLILMAGTTRPDALFAQSNLWISSEATYSIVKVGKEKWVVGKEAVRRIENQYQKPEVIGEIKATELISKWVKGPLVDFEILILPADFVDPKIGSGIVYSALETPSDYMEMKRIQSDPEIIKKYKLDEKTISKIRPRSVIKVEGMGENLGEEISKEFGAKSYKDVQKLELAKHEINKRVFRKGVMKPICGKYSGMTVPKAQEALKKDMMENNDSVMFYELSDKVVCRCLTACIIKMVSNQWFIEYNDLGWKKLAHKCLDKMVISPEVVRKQFEYVLDWLHSWACTREYGLGTELPWDNKWVIESLSDSTIQMAYNTISKYLQHPEDYGFKIDKLNDEFYDFVFLGKGKIESVEKSTRIPKKMIQKMRKDFEYWYPFDFRNTGKDLLQNHMAFLIFNHTALFPEKYWPKMFLVNGRILINNEKMSKSKGNFFTIREMYEKHGADPIRLAAANSGEGVDDANFDLNFLEAAKEKLSDWIGFSKEYHNNGRTNLLPIDNWFESVVNRLIRNSTDHMDNARFKSALQAGFFDLQRYLKIYMRRTDNKPNKKLISELIEAQTKILAPFTPHVAEEIWNFLGKKTFISNESWPLFDPKKINEKAEYSEFLVDKAASDIREVLALLKIEKPKQISIFISEDWKYSLFKQVKSLLEKTRNTGEILKEIMKDVEMKKHGKDVPGIVGALVKDPSRIPGIILDEKEELKSLDESKPILEKEFSCKVEIQLAEKSVSPRARKAEPGKPGIEVG